MTFASEFFTEEVEGQSYCYHVVQIDVSKGRDSDKISRSFLAIARLLAVCFSFDI